MKIGARYNIQNDGQTICLNVVYLPMLITHVTKHASKAMRNCFFYAITSYTEFRISVIPNQRNYTEITRISEPT